MKVFSTLAAALLLPVIVNAQNGTTVNVQVAAGGQLVFNPSNFTASNGTSVTFEFPTGALAHSVTQGSFANPCVYLNGTGGTGFDSGLQTVKHFTIQITNDQEPIWFFCKNTGHCGLGMVGAINPPTTGDTFAAYQAAAKALGANEQAITDNGPVTGGVGAVATATPTLASASSSSAPASQSSSTSSPGSYGSAGHLVTNGLLNLLGVAFGIALA